MTLDLGVSLQEAAQRIHPVRSDYQNLPIEQGFDWPVIAGHDFDSLYLVVFRSVRLPDADLDLLRWFDDLAYAEALRCGGLLRYFKGDADVRGHCLSFCLWESREAALRAAGGKKHEQAASITARMCVAYDLASYEAATGGAGGRARGRGGQMARAGGEHHGQDVRLLRPGTLRVDDGKCRRENHLSPPLSV